MRTGDVKLTRITASISSRVKRGTGIRLGIAALFTRQSRPSKASRPRARPARLHRGRPDRRPTAATRARARRHCASTCSSRSRRRATIPTVAPRAASIGASAAPIPDDAPVTRIVEPSTFMCLPPRLLPAPRPSGRSPSPSSTIRPRRGACTRRPAPRGRARRPARQPRPIRRAARRVGDRRCRRLPSARSAELRRAAGERSDLGGDARRRWRLQAGRVAVVPAAVEPPDVAHDELGLVVDRAEVRLARAGRSGARTRVHDLVERRARVHQGERLRRCSDSSSSAALGAAPAWMRSPPDDRQAVAGQQELGAERRPSCAARRPTPRG